VVDKIKATYHAAGDEFEIIASDDNADLLVTPKPQTPSFFL